MPCCNIQLNINDGDLIIAADAGLNTLNKLGIKPHLIVGDFDSHPNPNLPIEITDLDKLEEAFNYAEGVYIDFSKELSNVSESYEEEMIESIVYSLCDINGINYVYLSIDGVPLKELFFSVSVRWVLPQEARRL